MEFGPEDFRQHYASLSNEGLLVIKREDLNPVAQQCYDVELAQRGIPPRASKPAQAPAPGNLGEASGYDVDPAPGWANDAVSVGTFQEDLFDARDALEAAGIPFFIRTQAIDAAASRTKYSLMVPSGKARLAEATLQRDVYNPTAEETFKHHFEELTDDELLALGRDGVANFARDDWQREVARRELQPTPAPDDELSQDFVPVAEFDDPSEAEAALKLLQSAEIPSRLEPGEYKETATTRLMVPEPMFYRASEILDANVDEQV